MQNEQAEPAPPGMGDTVIFVLARHHIEQTGNANNGANESPAVVVHVFGPDCVNLRVLCDGQATLWVTSAMRGTEPGNWYPRGARPERVRAAA